jgi:tripartite-type tricarboxylate transporter receptor subunit TctC
VDGFDWITIALRYAFVCVVRADSPYQDLPALIAAAKRGAGAVQYGTLGPGSSHHLTGELLSAAAGIQMTPVPYRSDVAGLTGVLGGELPLMISTTVGAMSMLQDGKLRPLAVTSPRRSRALPQVPTVAETLPGYESFTWAGLVTPHGTPLPVQERLYEAMLAVLAQPALKQRLEELVDGEVAPTPRAETRGVLVAEIAKWKALIAARGLTAE